MTTIAALERNGSVYLAADAHSVSGCDRAHDDATPPMVSSNTGHIDGCVVLAHRGRVFYLTDGVVTTGEHFVTAGSGEDLALGALVAMLDDETLEPETIVARAVDVAGRYDSGTGPVGQVVWLDTTGKARELDVATALAQHT